MLINPVKTKKIQSNKDDLLAILDSAVGKLTTNTIVVITSKIVSICEGSYIPVKEINDKKSLIISESEQYTVHNFASSKFIFTIKNNILIPSSGIDESNANQRYVLWPKDAQASANLIRQYLSSQNPELMVGVVITDSTCRPLSRGTSGICIAHSGFSALKNYIGKDDLFGRPMHVTQANLAAGIAAAAVLVMGEGTEQTPVCLVTDLRNIDFQDRDPTHEELEELYIPIEEDLFEPFLSGVEWARGGKYDGR